MQVRDPLNDMHARIHPDTQAMKFERHNTLKNATGFACLLAGDPRRQQLLNVFWIYTHRRRCDELH